MFVPEHMARAYPPSDNEHVRQLRELAATWRMRARETDDIHYIALMTRTAEELEQHANRLEAPLR